MSEPKCPRCGSTDLIVQRRLDGDAGCRECPWVGPYKECFNTDAQSAEKEEKMEQKPSIGRIVLYMKYGTPGGEHKPEPSPAVITKVDEDGSTCHLFVMNPNGCYFNKTPYSAEPKGGHWSWPPRV